MQKTLDSKNGWIGDCIVAITICSQFINSVLCIITNSDDGYLSYIFIVIAVLIVLLLFSTNFRIQIVKSQAVFVGLIILGYVLTKVFRGYATALEPIAFISRCLIPLLIGMGIPVHPKRVLKIMMLFMIPGVPYLSQIFSKGNAGSYIAVTMGTSYAILPVILAGMTHYYLYKTDSTILDKILYIITIVYSCYFVATSYRGALLSMVRLFVLINLFKGKDRLTARRAILIFGLVSVLILYIIFKNQIIRAFVEFLSSISIRIASLDKAFILLSEDNELHGRLDIYNAAFQGIKNSPIIGHGYATFKYYSNYVFPHNFILEILFDLGVPIGVLIIIYIVKCFLEKARSYKKFDLEMFYFLLFALCCCIPRVLVSSECWIVISLWYMVGFVIRKTDYSYSIINSGEGKKL